MASSVRPGSRLRAAWNENISPCTLCNSVSCSSRAMRVRSFTRALQAHVEFVLQLPDTELVGRPQQCQKNGRAEGSKPVRPPPGGRDENRQRHPFFIPYAIAV